MAQEELRQEMEAVMKQLSPLRQQELLKLAMAFQRAESGLPPSLDKDENQKNNFEEEER